MKVGTSIEKRIVEIKQALLELGDMHPGKLSAEPYGV